MLLAEAQKSDFVTTVVSVASQIFKPSHVNKNRFLPYDQLGLKQKADVLCKHYFLNQLCKYKNTCLKHFSNNFSIVQWF